MCSYAIDPVVVGPISTNDFGRNRDGGAPKDHAKQEDLHCCSLILARIACVLATTTTLFFCVPTANFAGVSTKRKGTSFDDVVSFRQKKPRGEPCDNERRSYFPERKCRHRSHSCRFHQSCAVLPHALVSSFAARLCFLEYSFYDVPNRNDLLPNRI